MKTQAQIVASLLINTPLLNNRDAMPPDVLGGLAQLVADGVLTMAQAKKIVMGASR